MSDQRLGGGRPRLGDGVGNVLGTLAAAGEEDAVGEGVHRRELGVPLEEEALAAAAHVEQAADVLRVGMRLQAGRPAPPCPPGSAAHAGQRVLRRG